MAQIVVTTEEWYQKWSEFVEFAKSKSDNDISYLDFLYKSHEMWAFSFQGEERDLGLSTTQRGESINSGIKKFLSNFTAIPNLIQLLHKHNEIEIKKRWNEKSIKAKNTQLISANNHCWFIAIAKLLSKEILEEVSKHAPLKSYFIKF